MAFIIPDKTLEKLICDSCNKYSTVLPVKIYRNGDTKCGRCAATRTPDNGVSSLISLIGDNCLFKCINRFDGCRKLLSYSQVLSHEKTCISKVYQCPVCQDGDAFTSLLLERHFRTEHEMNILVYPQFTINLTALFEPSVVFFYIQEDFLFFISFRYNHSVGEIRISISLVGTLEQASKITRQFSLTSHDNQAVNFVSKKTPCSNTEMESNWFCVEESDVDNTKFLLVKFELLFNDPQCVQISNAIAANDDPPTLGAAGNPNNFAIEPYVPFTPMVVSTSEPKKIHLTPEFLEMYSGVITNPSCTAIIHLNRLVFLECKNCNDICWTGEDEGMDQFYICVKDQHSLCYCCFKYLRSQSKVKAVDYILTTLSWNLLKKIQFECKWGCGKSFGMINIDNILVHEGCDCDLGEYWSCGLCNFQGKTPGMQGLEHKSNLSGDCLLTSKATFPFSYLSLCDPYINISFKIEPFDNLLLKNNKLTSLTISQSTDDGYKKIAFVELNTNKIALLFDSNRKYLAQFRHSITFKCQESNVSLKIMILE